MKHERSHLFILSGQSNMAGLIPEESFTPIVEKALGQTSTIVVHDAAGGQPIRRWFKGWVRIGGNEGKHIGGLYDRLMEKVKEAIQGKALATVTFVWMQGERDAKEKLSEFYKASFIGILDQIKADLEIDHLNFVIGRLSDFDMDNAKYPDWTKVRDIQVELGEDHEYGDWISTDDLNNMSEDGRQWEDLHYTKEGYRILGKRFAEQAIQLVNKSSWGQQV